MMMCPLSKVKKDIASVGLHRMEIEDYSDVEQVKIAKDDYLKIPKFLYSDLLQNKLVKTILIICLIIHGYANILTIHHFITFPNLKDLFNYGPTLCVTSYGILEIVTVLYHNELVAHLDQELTIWSLEMAEKSTRKKIKMVQQISTAYNISVTLLALIGGLFFMTSLSRDLEIFFFFKYVHVHYPNNGHILAFMYKATYPVMGYMLTVTANQVIYYTQNIVFQIFLYNDKVALLDRWDEENLQEDQLFYDKNYQRIIKRRLIFCVLRLGEILRMHNNKLNESKHLIATYSLGGCVLGIGVVFYLLSDNFTPEYYPRMAFVTIGACNAFAGLIWTGQYVEDVADDTSFYLYGARWQNFRRENNQLFLILATILVKKRNIRFSENLAVNYDLGVRIVRAIYSIISVMAN